MLKGFKPTAERAMKPVYKGASGPIKIQKTEGSVGCHGWGEQLFIAFWFPLACAVPLVSWASRREGRWSEGAGEGAGAVVEVRGWPVSWHMDKAWEPHLSVYREQSTVHSISMCYNSRSLRISIPVLRLYISLAWKELLLHSLLTYYIPKLFYLFLSNILYSQDYLMYSSLHTFPLRFPCVPFSSISEIFNRKAIRILFSSMSFSETSYELLLLW